MNTKLQMVYLTMPLGKLNPVLPTRPENVFLPRATAEGQNLERFDVKFHSMLIHRFQFLWVIVFVVL